MAVLSPLRAKASDNGYYTYVDFTAEAIDERLWMRILGSYIRNLKVMSFDRGRVTGSGQCGSNVEHINCNIFQIICRQGDQSFMELIA